MSETYSYKKRSSDPGCNSGHPGHCSGVASVSMVDEEYDETGNRSRSAYHLIDETGSIIPLPEGIHAVIYEGAFLNRVMVEDDSGRYGYADVAAVQDYQRTEETPFCRAFRFQACVRQALSASRESPT